MFYYIKGTLAIKGENFAVIDANGVGYKLLTTSQSLSAAGEKGSEVCFYTYLHVGEDIFDLYGFYTNEELASFEQLIGVSGVGPKAALSILSVLTPPQFALAVASGDSKAISRAQGVGPKLAQRVILELKDKISNSQLVGDSFDSSEVFAPVESGNEAVDALVVLGYSAQEATKALRQADALNLPAEEAIKKALRYLI